MAFKTCLKCGKLVREVDGACWNCHGRKFSASTVEGRPGTPERRPPDKAELPPAAAPNSIPAGTQSSNRTVLFAGLACVAVLVLLGRTLFTAYSASSPRAGSTGPVAAPVPTPVPYRAAPTRAENTLDRMAREIVAGGQPLILSYETDGAFAILNINPAIWNALDRADRQELGDRLARAKAWDEMKLINAKFFVEGREVGRIKPNLAGSKTFLLY